jgi:hypothetical protein
MTTVAGETFCGGSLGQFGSSFRAIQSNIDLGPGTGDVTPPERPDSEGDDKELSTETLPWAIDF